MTDKELYSKKERVPLGRIAQPEDIVGPVNFLVSDKASHITGQTVLVKWWRSNVVTIGLNVQQ